MKLQLSAPASINARIKLPSSKSITNRALLISALCDDGPQVLNPALCDDTTAMIDALSHQECHLINVGPAGTAMRFLTAYFATREGKTVTLDGDARMRQRPIGPLVDALRSLGAHIDYPGHADFPPLSIKGKKLSGGDVTMPAGASSQFTSAIMMILPVAGGGTIHLTGDIVSAPYIHMTAAVMREMGAQVDITGDTISVSGKYNSDSCLMVESDWSAAAPWYAIATLLPQSNIILEGLTLDSIQGDSHLAHLANQLGIASRPIPNGVTLDTSHFIGCCCSAFADMGGTPDLAMSWAVLLCLLERSYRMTGIRTLKLKESDRLEALREGLQRLGYVLKVESEDAISWYGERTALQQEPPVINTHGDHRLAMAFAPAAVRFPGLIINEAQVVSKSYPSFWRHLEQAGFTLNELAQ